MSKKSMKKHNEVGDIYMPVTSDFDKKATALIDRFIKLFDEVVELNINRPLTQKESDMLESIRVDSWNGAFKEMNYAIDIIKGENK